MMFQERMIHEVEINNMLERAKVARDRSYSPYTGKKMGACLKGSTGAYYVGCLVENADDKLTMCATRTAIFKAMTDNERKFDCLITVTDNKEFEVHSTECTKVLKEICGEDMIVVLANDQGKYINCLVSDLPYGAKARKKR